MLMGQLQGKTAIVFGAGHPTNMGAAIVRRYAREGAKVIVGGRKAGPVGELAQEVGGDTLLCDITDEAELSAAAADLKARYGGIDIVVNTVGVHHHTPMSEATEAGIDMLVRAHIHGPIFLMKHIAPLIRNDGAVVMVSSVAGERNNNPPTVGIYAASKAATNRLMQTFAIEHGSRGIRVNAIAPGLVMTPMAELSRQKMGDVLITRMLNRTPLGRLATIDDIAGAAVFLASPDCFMTGEILQINGGFRLYDSGIPANSLSA
jgi:NAD(P)-dependent dehydrogenase (short-subunit alcohol dehydrogenase family)